MLRSLQTSDSCPSLVRSRLTPPTRTPSVVESMNVVFVKSTTTCLPPWPITSSSCCLNSGAVYRSTSPASEMTYVSSEMRSVLMSKFMGPPARIRVSLLLGGRELLQDRTHLRCERIRRRQLQELLVRRDRRLHVVRALRRLPELDL